jgi:hypothetical protein
VSAARRAALVPFLPLVLLAMFYGAHPAGAAQAPDRRVFVLILDGGVSFETLMRVPEIRQLARVGGVGLMTTRHGSGTASVAALRTIGEGRVAGSSSSFTTLGRTLEAHQVDTCERRGSLEPLGSFAPLLDGNCASLFLNGSTSAEARHLRMPSSSARQEKVVHDALRRVLDHLPRQPGTLIMVLAPSPSKAMVARGDEITPLVMAKGILPARLPANGALHTLTSDTTRQTGLVANIDVAPTILRFFALPIPSSMDGSPIRIVDAPAPFGLHRRHLEQRAIRFPLQMGELAFVALAAIVGFGLVYVAHRRGVLPPAVAGTMAFVALCVAALPLMVLAGGSLPRLTWAWVAPFLLLGIPLVALVCLVAGHARGPLGPFVILGWVGLAFLALDAVTGGRALRTPLFGGTMFDGARFYGLPNGFFALLLGSALFVAFSLGPFSGLLVLLGAGLYTGFPSLGADVGGAITMFFAAGLWWVLRTRHRFRLAEAAIVTGFAVVGLAVTLAASRVLPGAPTHVTRFVERTGGQAGSFLDTVIHRLGIGWHMVASVPAAIIPLIGFVAIFVLAARRGGSVGRGLSIDPTGGWRHVLMVLCASALVAYVVNDTGAAAADPVFVYAASGLVYPVMIAARRWTGPADADRAPSLETSGR